MSSQSTEEESAAGVSLLLLVLADISTIPCLGPYSSSLCVSAIGDEVGASAGVGVGACAPGCGGGVDDVWRSLFSTRC